MNRLLRAICLSPIAIALVALLSVGAAPAGAVSEIEGIWSFNGGQVAIHPIAGGKFEGIVVTPTKFTECAHKVGEAMWTDISPQSDGSYWGLHQWLLEKTCEANPSLLGPTAWRVQQKSGGSRDLLVCFSEPGGSQPTIAPNGASANVTRTCQESAPTAPLPVISGSGSRSGSNASNGAAERIGFATTIILPRTRGCVKRGSLKIEIRDPKYDPLKEVVVKIKKHKVAEITGVQRLKHGIVVKGLPSGSYTLEITATTVLNQKLSGKRKYHSCARRRSKIGLRRRKHHGRS
jgi:hypothetical protein